MNEASLHVFIRGRVQGVGFRYAARKEATRLNLTGYVRNLSDGRVEAEFTGARDALENMLHWCHEGPPLARVDDVIVDWGPPRAGQGGMRAD